MKCKMLLNAKDHWLKYTSTTLRSMLNIPKVVSSTHTSSTAKPFWCPACGNMGVLLILLFACVYGCYKMSA